MNIAWSERMKLNLARTHPTVALEALLILTPLHEVIEFSQNKTL